MLCGAARGRGSQRTRVSPVSRPRASRTQRNSYRVSCHQWPFRKHFARSLVPYFILPSGAPPERSTMATYTPFELDLTPSNAVSDHSFCRVPSEPTAGRSTGSSARCVCDDQRFGWSHRNSMIELRRIMLIGKRERPSNPRLPPAGPS